MRALRWVCCGMLVVAGWATAGCRSMAPLQDETLDITIKNDCTFADPSQADYVELDYGQPTYPGPYHRQVRWIIEKGADDVAVLSAKPVWDQDPNDHDQGRKIKHLLDEEYLFAKGKKDALSGTPKKKPPYLRRDDKLQPVTWKYEVYIHHAAGDFCKVDPGLCYRTPDGSVICR